MSPISAHVNRVSCSYVVIHTPYINFNLKGYKGRLNLFQIFFVVPTRMRIRLSLLRFFCQWIWKPENSNTITYVLFRKMEHRSVYHTHDNFYLYPIRIPSNNITNCKTAIIKVASLHTISFQSLSREKIYRYEALQYSIITTSTVLCCATAILYTSSTLWTWRS